MYGGGKGSPIFKNSEAHAIPAVKEYMPPIQIQATLYSSECRSPFPLTWLQPNTSDNTSLAFLLGNHC